MEKEPESTAEYYVLISYEPFDTRCGYKTLEAWCSVGELIDEQADFIRERLSISGEWQRITEPKCKEPTCDRTILLLTERDAVLRWWGAGAPELRRPRKATLHFTAFIGDQKLGFEQCQALEKCINLVKDALIKSASEGQDAKKVKSVAEQNIRVDLHSWESAATLEDLSRTAGIEPTEEFDTTGWIAEYLEKMGFGHHIQPYEEVKKKMFPSDLPTKSTTGGKSKGKKTSQNREELEGRRLAAVKYVQKHPEASLSSVEVKFNLGERTLSRSPYKEMIAKFAKNRGGGSKSKGRKDRYLGKNEKQNKFVSKNTPDTRRSHEEEVDKRLDGETET